MEDIKQIALTVIGFLIAQAIVSGIKKIKEGKSNGYHRSAKTRE